MPLTAALPKVRVRHGRHGCAYRRPRPQCSGGAGLVGRGCRPSYQCCQRPRCRHRLRWVDGAEACSGAWRCSSSSAPRKQQPLHLKHGPLHLKHSATLGGAPTEAQIRAGEPPWNGLASGAKRRRPTDGGPKRLRVRPALPRHPFPGPAFGLVTRPCTPLPGGGGRPSVTVARCQVVGPLSRLSRPLVARAYIGLPGTGCTPAACPAGASRFAAAITRGLSPEWVVRGRAGPAAGTVGAW